MKRWLLLNTMILLAFSCSLGCEKDEACDQARRAASDAWKDVKERAAKEKLGSGAAFDELDESGKKKHYEAWAAVSDGATLVFDSFAFERITWTAAKNGRDKVEQGFSQVPGRDKYASFQALLSAAQKRYSETESACR